MATSRVRVWVSVSVTKTPCGEKCTLLWCQLFLAIFGRKHELKKIKHMVLSALKNNTCYIMII
jgi:hypothetical protein